MAAQPPSSKRSEVMSSSSRAQAAVLVNAKQHASARATPRGHLREVFRMGLALSTVKLATAIGAVLP